MTSSISQSLPQRSGGFVESPETFDCLLPTEWVSWIKLLRVTFWIQRFCHNLRNKGQRSQGTLSVQELGEDKLYWVKWGQRDRYPAEVESLWKGRPVPRSSRISNLDPQILDEVLRVGGRNDLAKLA